MTPPYTGHAAKVRQIYRILLGLETGNTRQLRRAVPTADIPTRQELRDLTPKARQELRDWATTGHGHDYWHD